jgi:hypothetical protein
LIVSSRFERARIMASRKHGISPNQNRSTPAFARWEETQPNGASDEHGNPIWTLEHRREWQAESDRLADWFETSIRLPSGT